MNKNTEEDSFDWALAQSFLAVFDAGTLLGAARRLQCSQPTVGRQIAALELSLGVPLFERTGKGLRPTQAAIALRESAIQMQSGAMALLRGVAKYQTNMKGRIRLTATQSVAHTVLAPVLAAMSRELPHVAVDVVVSNDTLNLIEREADIAIRMVRPAQGSLVAQKIGEVGVGVYAHSDYLARHGAPQNPADLCSHALITDDAKDTIVAGFARFGIELPLSRQVLRSDDLSFQWQAVRAGCGIGFIAHYVAQQDPGVVRLLPNLPIPPLPVWLVVHREVKGNARIRAVIDYLVQALPNAFAQGSGSLAPQALGS